MWDQGGSKSTLDDMLGHVSGYLFWPQVKYLCLLFSDSDVALLNSIFFLCSAISKHVWLITK